MLQGKLVEAMEREGGPIGSAGRLQVSLAFRACLLVRGDPLQELAHR